MLNEKPQSLNLVARVSSSGRSFNEIPIWLPSSYGGFGDIMVTLKLAEGLKQEFPDKKVTVYFGNEEDYQDVQRLYPDFDPSKLEAGLNGVSVAQVSDTQMREIMSRNLVGIYSSLAITELPPIQDFAMDAGINFYVEEYDAGEKIRLPEGLRGNTVYEDRSGRKHIVLSTGFGDDSIGIHIDNSLAGLSKQASPEEKQEILERAGFQWVIDYVPNLVKSEWGLAYYADNYDFRTETSSNTLLKAMLRSFKETGNWDRAVTIFDFSKTDFHLVEHYYQHEPFTDIFLQEDGQVKVIKGTGRQYGKTTPNVYIVHVSAQDHSVFVDFLRYSEIPVAITGDASLAEAVSLDKPFMYHPPGWKNHVFPHFVEKAPDLLKDWRDADRIRSLFGCRRVKEEDVNSCAEVESFYLEHRANIHRAKELEREHYDRRDYGAEASRLFGKILREKGNKQSYELERYFKQHEFAFSMAYCRREKGMDEELRTLRKRHIFGTSTGIMGNDEDSRLFYDPEYQASFSRYNQALIQQMDISKNLAGLIRESAQQYQR